MGQSAGQQQGLPAMAGHVRNLASFLPGIPAQPGFTYGPLADVISTGLMAGTVRPEHWGRLYGMEEAQRSRWARTAQQKKDEAYREWTKTQREKEFGSQEAERGKRMTALMQDQARAEEAAARTARTATQMEKARTLQIRAAEMELGEAEEYDAAFDALMAGDFASLSAEQRGALAKKGVRDQSGWRAADRWTEQLYGYFAGETTLPGAAPTRIGQRRWVHEFKVDSRGNPVLGPDGANIERTRIVHEWTPEGAVETASQQAGQDRIQALLKQAVLNVAGERFTEEGKLKTPWERMTKAELEEAPFAKTGSERIQGLMRMGVSEEEAVAQVAKYEEVQRRVAAGAPVAEVAGRGYEKPFGARYGLAEIPATAIGLAGEPWRIPGFVGQVAKSKFAQFMDAAKSVKNIVGNILEYKAVSKGDFKKAAKAIGQFFFRDPVGGYDTTRNMVVYGRTAGYSGEELIEMGLPDDIVQDVYTREPGEVGVNPLLGAMQRIRQVSGGRIRPPVKPPAVSVRLPGGTGVAYPGMAQQQQGWLEQLLGIQQQPQGGYSVTGSW